MFGGGLLLGEGLIGFLFLNLMVLLPTWWNGNQIIYVGNCVIFGNLSSLDCWVSFFKWKVIAEDSIPEREKIDQSWYLHVRLVMWWHSVAACTAALLGFATSVKPLYAVLKTRLFLIFYWSELRAESYLTHRYNAVIQSWQFAFNWEQGLDFQVRDVRARVLTDMAWVTMKMYVVEMDNGPFNVTNVFEFHNGRWHLVHHHCSVMVLDGEVDQQIMHA